MRKLNVDMIIDLQFGSTGKGLIAGFLAKRRGYDTVVTANMPNAGHTFVDSNGRKWIHKVLPNGIVGPTIRHVAIGPGAIYDLGQLEREIEGSFDLLCNKTIFIHEASAVLQPRHSEAERNSLNGIASTMQGSMAAMVERLSRDKSVKILTQQFVEEIEALSDSTGVNIQIVGDYAWSHLMSHSNYVLAEGAQGYSLGISAGMWPYCTSRDCTPARFMADMGLPHNSRMHVIGTARTYPIRVGNTPGGYSGDCYGDQREIKWEEIGIEPELTTVTKRPRRIFTFSKHQIENAIAACRPDSVFLNFCNYVADTTALEKIMSDIECTGAPIGWRGYGPSEDEVVEVF